MGGVPQGGAAQAGPTRRSVARDQCVALHWLEWSVLRSAPQRLVSLVQRLFSVSLPVVASCARKTNSRGGEVDAASDEL